MRPVKLGVIGCGVIGKRHAQLAAESSNIDLAAVADLRDGAAQTVADDLGVGKVYNDGADLIDDPEIEAVVLAMPACVRTELALRAFAKDKHVRTEKPVAMNADEVKQMIAARGELVAACCSSRFRFPKAADVATDFIATGALGDLRVVHCRALVETGGPPEKPRPEWRLKKHLNAGGIMSNWGCYDLDYLLGITGWKLEPKTVFAQIWQIPPQLESHVPPDSDAETHTVALVRCEGGTVISLERGEYMAAPTEGAWHIVGSKGSVKLSMTPGKAKTMVYHEATPDQGLVAKTIHEGDDTRSDGHKPVVDFADAIRENRQPKTGLEQALIVQRITDGIYASAECGTAVDIE